MNNIITNNGNIVKVFARTFEKEAYKQVETIANLEAYKNSKIRIMPDAHAGASCVIGTTMTIFDKVTPNLVGVDIGCGMLTIELKDKHINYDKLDSVIRMNIPSGFNINEYVKTDFDLNGLICRDSINVSVIPLSIGSLGGGNHFIEIDYSESKDKYYLVIHTGSRNLGYKVCKYYQKKAVENITSIKTIINDIIAKLKAEHREKEIEKEIKKIRSNIIDFDENLSYLSGYDFECYLNDMQIVQNFASVNRNTIANTIIKEIGFNESSRFETVHNYIDFKRMILRKGAVSAELGEELIIPINMRDGSLICTGKGNIDWNYSAPHGAGRIMSRSEAKKSISMNEFKMSMNNIYTTSINENTLDEAPMVYKSMKEIIETIEDTVYINDIIRPKYNFKA